MRSRSRSAIENVDVAAATFVVGADLQIADFLTIQDAIDNAPPEGADIYVLPGTYTQSSALLSVTVPIAIRGSGIDVTTIDFGTLAGKFISIDHDAPISLFNLTIFGGNVAGQYLYDVSTNYLGNQTIVLENVMVGSFATDAQSIEGGFLGQAFATLKDVSLILQNTAASYFADAGAATPASSYFICYNVYAAGTGATRQKWGGFKNQPGIFAENSLFGCANFGALGFLTSVGFTSFVGGGGTSTLTSSNFSSIVGVGLNDVALSPSNDTIITGGVSGIVYSAAARIIDIATGVDGITIVGFSFASWTSETIRNDGTHITVSGCIGFVTGDIKILETANADFNNYWDIDASSTIVGANTKVNGAKLGASSTSTTAAFVSILGPIVNPKGLKGSGTIKNTGANSMDVKELFTDAFGTVSTLTTAVSAGNELPFSLDINIGTGRPSYTSYEIQVQDTVAASHTTFVLEFSSQGAML